MVPQHVPLAIGGALVGIAVSGGVLNYNALLAFISLLILVGAFNTFNGVTDFKIDLINKPYRPIPSGKITRPYATMYAIILYMIGLIISYSLTREYLLIYIIAVILSILYSLPIIRLRKRFLINSLTVTILYGLLCPLAGWALMPSNPIPIYMLAFLLLFGFGLSITKDFEDFLGDKVYSNNTIPVKLGPKTASFLTATVLIISFTYLYSAITLGMLGRKYLLTILLMPGFLFLIRKMYIGSNNNHRFSNEKTRSRTIFYMLIGLGVLVEIMIGIIAFLI
jgi:geranylgeranylglycerol-phosphate geranylgeranyltransferase